MGLLLSRPANTSGKQPITHLKPSTQPSRQIPVKRLKSALFLCFFTQMYVVYVEWS